MKLRLDLRRDPRFLPCPESGCRPARAPMAGGTRRRSGLRAVCGAFFLGVLAVASSLIAPPAGAGEADPPAQAQPSAAPPAAGGPATASDARLAGDAQRTRLVIDLDRAVEFHAFTLAEPYRVILDLPEVAFALRPESNQLKRGLVSAYRFGVFAPGKARMVLEVTGPVAIDKAFVLDPVDDQPARLVVDLVKTDPDTFARTAARSAAQRTALPATPIVPPEVGDTRPVVVLDPGHGGIDSGTTGYSAFAEKNVVLETALAVRELLERSGAYRVVMTRSTDTFVPLGERVRIARAHRADLFVSFHADALARGEGQARGASVYTLAETASDADAAHLAEKENKADLIAGVDLSDETDEVAGILVDLAQRETRNFSALLARSLVGAMKSTVRFHRSPLKSAGFRVLRAHDVPSVLVEIGYMSSKEDLKLLTSPDGRGRIAESVVAGINQFFAQKASGLHAAADDKAAVPR
ncbi:N-acetylmuramoyl-L-alanine amidase [Xanthobacter sp. DSM 14520]|uniref:N-acetylmuramoyl-L-alanine amidase n=1 Tax=Xanthobacter autotrophicus (strain ATCC BAA-1158 / Py2) TaxID=78245 RepID=UPI003729E0F7